MPVKTDDGKWVDIPLRDCVGRACDDGRFHVILKDGTRGVWIKPSEVEAEMARDQEAKRKLLYEPVKRKIKIQDWYDED